MLFTAKGQESNNTVKLLKIDREDFTVWKEMRNALYKGVDDKFHNEEMNWIYQADDKAAFFILTAQNDITGFTELSIRNTVDGCIGDHIGYLEGLYLKPEYRQQQLGLETVNEAIIWFKAHDCNVIATDTELVNTEAQSFFSHIGFSETWKIVQFKKDLRGN